MFFVSVVDEFVVDTTELGTTVEVVAVVSIEVLAVVGISIEGLSKTSGTPFSVVIVVTSLVFSGSSGNLQCCFEYTRV